MSDIRITTHEGELLANGLPLDYHRDMRVEMLQLYDDLDKRKVTPSSVIGKGYGNNSREIAKAWVSDAIIIHGECAKTLERLGLES
jgi:hypothetical protein